MDKVFIAGVVSVQLVCQVVMQLLVVRLAGVGEQTDTYLAAQAVPMALTAVLINALQSASLPRLTDCVGELAWMEQVNTALGQAVILGAVSIPIGFAAPFWLPLLYPTFSPSQYSQATLYTGFLLFSLVLTTNSSVLMVALRVRGQHLKAEVLALVGAAVAVIATYFSVSSFGIFGAVLVQVLRAGLVLLLQLWVCGWPKPSPQAGLRDQEAWQIMRPLILSGGIFKVGPVIDRFIAGLAPSGTLTIFVLAQTIVVPFLTLIEQVMCVPALTRISRSLRSGYARHPVRLYIREMLQITMLTSVMAALGVLLFSQIVALAGGALEVADDDATLLVICALVLLLYVAFTAFGRLVTASFYASGDSRSTAVVGIGNFFISVAAKILLFDYLGIVGLAVGVAAFPCLNVAALLLWQSRLHAKNNN